MVTRQKTKVVCSVVATVPGEYGDTITITFDAGYCIESREDEKHLIDTVKSFVSDTHGEESYVSLFDEHGNEIWVR